MVLSQWARRWGVGQDALDELRRLLVADTDPEDPQTNGDSETAAVNRVRLAASRDGARLWRNNSGAALDDRGVMVRYGLCNDSAQLNKRVKSSDLIGIIPTAVRPEHVGQVWGVFCAVEVKRPGWKYSGRGREAAQRKFLETVLALGGVAYFSTGEWI